MKLQKASIWVQEHFAEDSRPCLRTIRKWIETGVLVGRIIDNRIYVDTEAFTIAAAKREEFQPKTRNQFEFIN